VQCLATLPAKTPTGIAAGAKNRYDDFVAVHINSTLSIHGTGNFLSWHRYFTWAYEQTLRNECGYKGSQPYYQWAYWAEDPTKSPALDGSATSLSGNGAYVAGRNNTCIPSPDQCGISLPPSQGGGCVQSGPFKDWQVNLGPVSPVLPGLPANPEFSGLGYNPRCLRRDISRAASSWTKDTGIVSLIRNSTDFLSFTTTMQGDFGNGFLGVHTGGHFTVGGDPGTHAPHLRTYKRHADSITAGGDLFASPGDPYFFLHHAMIDRTYWSWQNLDLAKRQYALAGTITLNNMPPSRNATLSDPIDLGYVGVPVKTIGELSNTLGGPFCYIYA
jgi:tyrosinase